MKNAKFRAQDRLRLHRYDAASAVAVGQEVVDVGKREGEALPQAVSESLGLLVGAHDALARADRDRTAMMEIVADDRQEARRAANAAWGAFSRWVSSWSRLADREEALVAKKIETVLFQDGLAFLQGSPKTVLGQMNQRLTLIVEKDLEASVIGIGGRPFVDQLRAKTAAYGEALHGVKVSPEISALRPALDGFRERLRAYVIQVSAMAMADGSSERGDRLLAPLAEWKSPRPRSRKPRTVDAPAPNAADGSP